MDGLAAQTGWTGRAQTRREDAALLRGEGRFVDDIAPDGCLALEFLRSPFASGLITVLDGAAARAAPGVVAVLTAADLTLSGRSGVNTLLPDAALRPMEPLAQTGVFAVGQAVVAVIATSRDAARDAIEMIDFEVDEGGKPREGATKAQWGQRLGPLGDAVNVQIDHARLAPFAIEPRAALAVPTGAGLTLWLSTQTPQRCRDDLCAMLNLPRGEVRVIAPDVGGAFGGKASLMPEDAVVAFAAMHLQRPVKWSGGRGEDFLAATQGRGATCRAEMAVDAAGRATGLRAQLSFPLGHWMPYSALAPVRNGGRILPGPYAIPADVTAEACLGEGAAVNIYRGAGRPEAAMLMERLMDKAAVRLGLEPLEIRRRNLATPDGPGVDRPCSGDFAGLLDRLAIETDYSSLRAAQTRRRAQGELCGIGLALYVEPCGQGWETAALTLCADGRFLASTGSSSQGQGRETAMAQIVAGVMGLDSAQIDVTEGDSARTPEGTGALASRSTAIGGSAMMRAAGEILVEGKRAAAALLRCETPEIAVDAAGVRCGGTCLTWAAFAQRLSTPLHVDIRHVAQAEAWASGAVLAEVTIDAETGTTTIERITWVDDAGVVINPLLVEGQLLGGAAQGIGAAMMEQVVYDDGQLLTGSLMDYAVPRASDMPPIRLFSQPVPSPANPLGVKGVGEAGCIGVPAALLNAVMDALPPGTPDLSLPLTPEKVWRALTGKSL